MANVEFSKLKEGSVVFIKGNFGTGPALKGTITEVCEDVKNGQPGVDYVDSDGTGWWAYKDQIVGVYSY